MFRIVKFIRSCIQAVKDVQDMDEALGYPTYKDMTPQQSRMIRIGILTRTTTRSKWEPKISDTNVPISQDELDLVRATLATYHNNGVEL